MSASHNDRRPCDHSRSNDPRREGGRNLDPSSRVLDYRSSLRHRQVARAHDPRWRSRQEHGHAMRPHGRLAAGDVPDTAYEKLLGCVRVEAWDLPHVLRKVLVPERSPLRHDGKKSLPTLPPAEAGGAIDDVGGLRLSILKAPNYRPPVRCCPLIASGTESGMAPSQCPLLPPSCLPPGDDDLRCERVTA
jgi:hypothetical protein